MKTEFELKVLSDTAFEIKEVDTFSEMLANRVTAYYVTRVETKEKLIREGLIALGWAPPK